MAKTASTSQSSLERIYKERLDVWSDIQDHLPFLYDVATKGGTIVELGVRDGNSTSAFLAGLAASKTGGRLVSVDINPVPEIAEWVESGLWTTVVGDDLTLRYAPSMPQEIDVCFIDTLHWFHHTLAELRLYAPISEVVLLHDTELEAPWQQPPGEPAFPVREAIKMYIDTALRYDGFEFDKKGKPVRLPAQPVWRVEWRTGSYGMAVLRRR